MKNKKRWLAGLLAVVLIFSSGIGSAWAEDERGTSVTSAAETAEPETEEQEETVSDTDSAEETEDTEKDTDTTAPEEPGGETAGAENDAEDADSEEQQDFLMAEASMTEAPIVASLENPTDSFEKMCNDIFGISYEGVTNSEEYAEVYVGENTGSEQTGELGSATKPYGTLSDAYQGVVSSGKKGAIVHLLESYSTVKDSLDIWPESSVPMLIMSDAYDAATLTMSGDTWNFQDNVGFYQVQIKLEYGTGATSRIFANGHTVVFGGYGENNFAFINEGETRSYPTLFGASASNTGSASAHSSVSQSCLKIYGGKWSQIFGGGEYYSDVSGEAKLTISGYIASQDTEGAVTFSNKNMAYMEKSSYIYGGGAGVLQNVAAEEDFSHCVSTSVTVEYVTLDKSITPNGGYVEETAELNLKNSTVNGVVHVYSEGRPAKKDTLNIENSVIKRLGCFGENIGDVTQKYRIAREDGLEELTFNVNDTTVNEQFLIRSGKLMGNKNNDIQETNVNICNSNLKRFYLGAGATTDQRNDKQNELLNLRIENSKITEKMNSFYGFCKIGQMTLVGMGTEESPFLIEKETFGSYSHNREIEKLELKNSVVSFADTYTVGTIEQTDSSIRMKNGELNVTDIAFGAESSKNTFCFTNDTFINVYGNISGAAELDFSGLSEDGKRAGVWKKGEKSGTDYFTKKDTEGIVFRHDGNTKMEYWYGYRGEEQDQNWIYLDGEDGDDNSDGKTISTAVKTMEKAVELVTADSTVDTIVLCEKYYVTASTSGTEAWLIPKGKGSTRMITVTMQDDMVNYKTQNAGIYINYPEFTGNAAWTYLNLGSSFQFENIDFYSPRAGQYPGILCDGYNTYIGEGVTTVISQETGKGNGVISIYTGNAEQTDQCSEVKIMSGTWGWIYLGGLKKTAVTGSTLTMGDTLKLVVGAKNSGIGLNGSVYGNIDVQCMENVTSIFCGNAKSAAGTVYGNLNVGYHDGGGARFVSPCPKDVIVKGNVTLLSDNEATYYNICSVPDCTIEGDLTINLNNPGGGMDPGTDKYRTGYGCWLWSDKTTVGGTLTWNVNAKDVRKVGMSGKNQWVKDGGKIKVTLNQEKLNRVFVTEENSLDGTSMSENPYADCDNVQFTINGTNAQLSELNGMGKLILNKATLEVDAALSAKEVEIINNSYLKTNGKVTVGSGQNGRLSILSGATLEAKGGLLVNGSIYGAENGEKKGTLINNYGDEDGKVELIQVTGGITGQTYYYTTFEEASIQAAGVSKGDEIQALPPDENNYTYTWVKAEPGEESGSVTNRVWTVTNLKSRKYVYVNGTYSSLSDEEYAKHDGTTPELAYRTVKEAYDVVLKKGYIVICGDTEVSEWPSNATVEATVTSKLELENNTEADYYSDASKRAKLIVKGNLSMLCKTSFDNLCFELPSTHVLKANGYPLSLGHAHSDSEPSIVVKGEDFDIWGANADRQVQVTVEPRLTIYDGTYGIVSVYSHNQTNEISCANGVLKIYGGSFGTIYTFSAITDRLSEASVTDVYMERAEIRNGIYAVYKPQYAQGTFNITLGGQMSFSDTSGVYLGNFDYYKYENENSEKINFKIANTGESYKIPQIYCGSYYKAPDVDATARKLFITMDLSNVDVGSLYCGASADIAFSSEESKVSVNLGEHTQISKLYYGGSTNKCIANVSVVIASDSAVIDELYTTSERESVTPAVSSRLTLKSVGTKEKPYTIPKGWNLTGLTDLIIENTTVDVTNVQKIGTKQLHMSNSSKLYSQAYEWKVTGDYISDGTAEWYWKNVPAITFGGTVTGKTKVVSLSPDASADNRVTGQFYNGISICAKSDSGHSAGNFVDYENKELNFRQDTETDEWYLSDQGDTTARTQIYVSEERGSDSNAGTYGRPVKTIQGAYEKAEEFYQADHSKTELNIRLLSDVNLAELDKKEYSQAYKVTIESNDMEELCSLVLNDQNQSFGFPVDTTLKNLKIVNQMRTVSAELYANGHRVEVADTVITAAAAGCYPIIYGGGTEGDYDKTELSVNGGTWNAIYGGSNKIGSHVKSVNLYLGGKTNTKDIGTTSELTTGVFGGSASGTVDDVKLSIDGGTYFRIFGGGNTANASVNGTIQIQFNNGSIQRLYGGGQYAEAGNIEVSVGGGEAASGQAVITESYRGSGLYKGIRSDSTAKTYVKKNAVISSGEAKNAVQFAAGGYSGSTANAELYVEGGMVNADLYGGGWGEGTPGSYGNVNRTYIQITGGTITGNIYGGGNLGLVTSEAQIDIIGGTITGNIYGGGNAAGVASSKVSINSNEKITGSVFGGSYNITEAAGNTQKNTFVQLIKAEIEGAVFGGSDTDGLVSDTAKVEVNGSAVVTDGIFGGGSKAALQIQPQVTVAENAAYTGSIFGGGKGELKTKNRLARAFLRIFTASDLVDANVPSTNVVINGTVNGDVFGGGEYATVGTMDENADAETLMQAVSKVTVNGTVNGMVFGGGQNAPVAGDTAVRVTGGTYSTIFGGNDISGEIQGTAGVSVTGGQTERVYGGGYGAAAKATSVSVTGGTAGTVFGGGNEATVTGSAVVEVNTTDNIPHVDTVFAGNNKAAMAIKPILKFTDGRIGTVYCGGNQGVMTYRGDSNQGLEYTFDYPDAEITTVYAGCNDTTEQTADVVLTLVSGTYDTVYGGNNQNGNMKTTGVVVAASTDSSKALNVQTIYGGGNRADAENTAVTVKNGTVDTLYGGGNAATVTEAVKITTGSAAGNADSTASQAVIKSLYCGNNEAEMRIAPEIDLKSAAITNFYGGGNKGIMSCTDGLNYTFDADDLIIDTIYGGGNEAGVTTSVTLNVKKGNYTTIYGGSNSAGTVAAADVNILGNVGTQSGTGTQTLTGKVFGGGRGADTMVDTTHVAVQNGIIAGNVYGGSGFGKVGSANVTVKEDEADADAKVQISGNVFGAGYGVASSVEKTSVNVDLKLKIVSTDAADGDVKITEKLKSSEDTSGESVAAAAWLNGKAYTSGSYIAGNVYGGGDMGQVGKGYINVSTNTAVIEQAGTTSVRVSGGYIHGNIFGGGNGQPGGTDEDGKAITEYTVYMGTVFGTSHVTMDGGYVNGNVFGCGQQSRIYAAEDETGDEAADAAVVMISAESAENPILIGGSIFGGGNKGNGTTQNASVATTYGDTHVTLRGTKGQYTPIYLLSNGTTGGGVYGDGNLCLVSGKKYVALENFNCGVGENASMLKTFYSLQRADVVDLTGSRIVLKGAVDLVAENADDTMYSINRVSQLNLKESSTVKVTRTVNLLGELTSDEQKERQFIDRGNNKGNSIGNNTTMDNGYTASGGAAPAAPLTDTEVQSYISAYNNYISGKSFTGFGSVNVVCVANGGYLEIKKSATEYGPVTGLFTLQLVNANPGEGGGFVYADIMGRKVKGNDGKDSYVTGNFICVTKQKEDSSADYMYAYHNVGGQLGSDGKYEYYVWYLKGNKYNYDVALTAYIGTKDTDFTKTVSLAVEPGQSFVLTELTQSKEVSGMEPDKMYQNTWNAESDADKSGEKLAVEVTLITNEKSGTSITKKETQIGYLGYQTADDTNPAASAKKTDGKLVWGIWRSDGGSGWKFQPCANPGQNNSFQVKDGDALASVGENVVNAQLKFTLHKGTGMTTEFRNLPFEMKIAEVGQSDYDKAVTNKTYIEDDSCIRLSTNLNLSAIRLVPTQAAYMGSGRMFAGVSSSTTVNITDTSAFTAQFVTKYVPSAFNTGSQNQITETLTARYDNTYLLDSEGVGYTIKEETDGTITILNLTNNGDPDVSSYRVVKLGDGNYQVSYLDGTNRVMKKEDGTDRSYICKAETQSSSFAIPKGTVITLLASLDEGNPTYWYYYCTEDTAEIELGSFTRMNTADRGSSASGMGSESTETVYDTISTTSSSRVTENMIFVFDFSNVENAAWNEKAVRGNVMLKHTYASGKYTADIMDYVSSDSVTQNGQTTAVYSREMPKSTEEFKIARSTDGIQNFEITNENGASNPTYGQKDVMKFNLNINPDTTVTNTQYEEREYAVILTLQKKDTEGLFTSIPFPEGTIFTYKGERLPVGAGNQYVIVPVQSVGAHQVELEGQLTGFDPNEYQLTAKLYSTSETGYYNSLPINHADDSTTAVFTVKADPVYALQVTETGAKAKNHLLTAGDILHFLITAKEEAGAEDSSSVDITLYQYDKASGTYKVTEMDQVLEKATSVAAGINQKWEPTVSENAAKGTYRLEFRYHNRTEYWDFMVNGE